MINYLLDAIVFTFWVYVFYRLFVFIAAVILESHQERVLKEVGEALEVMKEVTEKHIPAKVEQHGDIFYLFHRDTDHFIAQGRDATEIADRTKPGVSVYITDGDADVKERFKATIPADA